MPSITFAVPKSYVNQFRWQMYRLENTVTQRYPEIVRQIVGFILHTIPFIGEQTGQQVIASPVAENDGSQVFGILVDVVQR